jgi:hypothetical protein
MVVFQQHLLLSMGETATLSWHPIVAIHLSDVVFL